MTDRRSRFPAKLRTVLMFDPRLALVVALLGTIACVAPGAGDGGSDGVTPVETSGEESSSGDGDPSGEVDPSGSGDGDGEPGDGDADSGSTKFDLLSVGDVGLIGGTICSDDLHQILDIDWNVLADCGPGTACYGGDCIEMCAAAGGSRGSIGCEYHVPTPPFFANQFGGGTTLDGACHAVMIANAWDTPAQLELSFFGEDYDYAEHTRIPSGIGPNVVYEPIPPDGIPPGQVAILFLSHNTDAAHAGTPLTCPITPAIVDANAVAFGTGGYEAWELISDTPVTVYDMLPYGGASSYLPSASLLQPRTAWGQNYVVATPHDTAGRAWVLAVAREDDTTVSIDAAQVVDDGTIAAPPVHTPTDYVIDAGETLQWMSSVDLGGTVVQADKPIGVWAGNTYLRVQTLDTVTGGHDSTHQQLPHVQALASEYVGPGIPSRKPDFVAESVLYQIVGVVDGTQLSYDPIPSPIAPLTLDLGEVFEFESSQPFTVRSQDDEHPFALTQYMSGAIDPSAGGCLQGCGWGLGDEEWITVVPPAQYMRRYVFFVDPTYGVGSLALVRTRAGEGEFADVELECLGKVEGWTPVGNEGHYEVAHVDLYRGGVGICAQSQQQAWSAAPFGIVVWGVDDLASYAYPAGGNARELNELIVPVG